MNAVPQTAEKVSVSGYLMIYWNFHRMLKLIINLMKLYS